MTKAKETETAKVEESKADKFKRLGSARVTKALDAIKSIGNLASPNYESTPDQRAKIVEALNAAVQEVKDTFDGKVNSGGGFSL